jgi:hypothetical protein
MARQLVLRQVPRPLVTGCYDPDTCAVVATQARTAHRTPARTARRTPARTAHRTPAALLSPTPLPHRSTSVTMPMPSGPVLPTRAL